MNTKNFKRINNILIWFFKILSIFSLIAVVVTLFYFFFRVSRLEEIEFHTGFSYFFSMMSTKNAPANKALIKPDLIVVSVKLAMTSFISFKACSLFDYLRTGKTPFTQDFARRLKQVSKILVITDLAIPLLRSLLITLMTSASYYFVCGFTWVTIVAGLLYIFSGIISYGVSLQDLSDETV